MGCFYGLQNAASPPPAPTSLPWLQDMSRLGRDIKRCVLVDDTPLAFYYQPDNGIPVLNFRYGGGHTLDAAN
jgi:hypothetical protein